MNHSSIFQDFANLSILIIGDVMIDRYIHGIVERISPEAPVPVVRTQSIDNRLGGAANVALNIKAMGAKAVLCSMIGQDESAMLFGELLAREQLSASGVLRSPERQTTLKTRVLSANQQLLRVDQENTHDLSKSESQQLLEKLENLLDEQKIDLILLQDYNKGVLQKETIAAILASAQKHHLPTVVDPKFQHFYTYQGVDLLKPNLKEIRAAVPFEVNVDLNSLTKASNHIRQRLQHRITLVTLGEKGVFLDDGQQQFLLPTQARSIADVCGAGDSVISIAALALALNMDYRTIAKLSNLAGGQVCERVGVVPIDKNQIIKEYEDKA